MKSLRTTACAATLLMAPLAAQTQPGLGTIEFPTSGSAAAQPHVLRGVALLHSFEYDDAAKAFRLAQQADPGFAMAYWGEAMTFTHPVWNQQDRDAARSVLARLGPDPAARRARAKTPREQGYLEGVEIRIGSSWRFGNGRMTESKRSQR